MRVTDRPSPDAPSLTQAMRANGLWGLCEYVIVLTLWGGSPVILWISLGGKPKWLSLKFGYHDVMRTSPVWCESNVEKSEIPRNHWQVELIRISRMHHFELAQKFKPVVYHRDVLALVALLMYQRVLCSFHAIVLLFSTGPCFFFYKNWRLA